MSTAKSNKSRMITVVEDTISDESIIHRRQLVIHIVRHVFSRQCRAAVTFIREYLVLLDRLEGPASLACRTVTEVTVLRNELTRWSYERRP